MRTWIKRREEADGARSIRSEKLGECQYRKGYSRSFEEKGVKGYGDNNIEHM